MDLHHPLFQSVVLPLSTAAVLAGALRMAGRREGFGPRIAPHAALAGLTLSAALVLGIDVGAPLSATAKLAWVFAACLLAGVVASALRLRATHAAGAAAALLAMLGLWLAWPQIGTGRGPAIAALAGFWLAAIALLGASGLGARTADAGHGASPLAALVIGSLGLAGVAFQSGSLVLFQLALALAAALGGVGLWNWPVARDRLDAAATIVPMLAATLLAFATWLLTGASPLALALLAGIVAAPPAVRHAIPRARGTAIEPLLVAALAVVPALAAVWLAAPGAAAGPYYQGR